MAKVGDAKSNLLEKSREALRSVRSAEQQLDDLIKSAHKGQVKAAQLLQVDVRGLDEAGKSKLMEFLSQQLRGQIPAQLQKGLAGGSVAADILDHLMQRLANASGANLNQRYGQAPTPEAAREMATDKSAPQQALRWTQFVQKVQHVPGARVQGRAGVASPRGEGTTLIELLSAKLTQVAGPGFRSPHLVGRTMADLSPTQRALLMKATFGERLGGELMQLGIEDPMQFVAAGAMPQDRTVLSRALSIPRARLLGLLMRAEMLKLGAGRNGELGMRPEFLGPLRQAGIVMMGTLGVIRSLPKEEMAFIYMLLRQASGGFFRALKGRRGINKRDLLHWSRGAGRQPSEILLADVDDRGFDRADAQELIQAWYMENLLWEKLAEAKRRLAARQEAEHRRVEREEREERGQRDRDDRDDEPAWLEDLDQELEYDPDRADQLICFWITDFNVDPTQPAAMRRMYVCIDPDTGAIIPQSVEASFHESM